MARLLEVPKYARPDERLRRPPALSTSTPPGAAPPAATGADHPDHPDPSAVADSDHLAPVAPVAIAASGLTNPQRVLAEGGLPGPGGDFFAPARRLVSEGTVSVLSLDVFDTLLWRRVARPSDAFVLLAEDLRAAGLLGDGLSSAAFRRLRMAAEFRARHKSHMAEGRIEVSLEEIWEQIPAFVLAGAPARVGVEHEIALERRFTEVDLDVAALARFADTHGVKVALVSNTYFTAQQLARLLSRPEFDLLERVRIFASSAYGVHKANGLWPIVLGELGVAPQRILHVGDEELSDVEIPQRHNLRTLHYHRLTPPVAEICEREGTSPPAEQAPLPHACHPVRGDHGLTTLRARVGGRVHGSPLPADTATAWRFGATVLGPALTGFADWVGRSAADLGVSSVWCMMREGELLAELVNRSAACHGNRPPAGTVWVSRQVTARAAIGRADPDELRRLLVRRIPPTVGGFLTDLGLGAGEVPEYRHLTGERLDREDLVAEVVGTLAGNEHLRSRIVEASADLRRRLLRSLAPMLAAPEERSVIVDLGWQGSIQRNLVRALALAGVDRQLVGLYLATNSSACETLLDGVEMRGYLADCGEPDALAPLLRTPEILEQTCLAATGSLVDIDGSGGPVLDGYLTPPEQVSSTLAVQQGIRAFQREWLRYLDTDPDYPRFDGSERDYLVTVLRRSITHPSAAEARTLGSWAHDDNFGDDLRSSIVPERLSAYVPYLSAPDLLDMTMHEAYWPLGLATCYDPGLAATTRAVLTGTLSTGDLEPLRRPMVAQLSVDCNGRPGAGTGRPLRVNRNGLSYLHFSLQAEGVVSVRFDPCDAEAFVVIDWIDLALSVRGADQPVRARLETSEHFASLGYQDCLWLTDGIVLATGPVPKIHLPVGLFTAAEVYGVELTAALAALPIPGGSSARLAAMATDPSRSLAVALRKVRRVAAEGGPGAVGAGLARFARRRLG